VGVGEGVGLGIREGTLDVSCPTNSWGKRSKDQRKAARAHKTPILKAGRWDCFIRKKVLNLEIAEDVNKV
jgi:hypothetical protein